ncbi:MAG TPA: SRPBCC domain-containing protein [Candidatus Dormibacteraeota bacterium]|nr:SRPBCC domain-containing protein [Candidatus Dormibacteraeota bacterium]
MSTTATIKENNIKLQLTRVFDAPRELVFKAWTDANQFKQWFGAAACDGASLRSVKVDACVGGKYRLQAQKDDGEFFTTVGIYREVKPPERLVFTWAFEKDGSGEEFGEVEPPEMLVTLEFKARGKQTELLLTHEKFASVESRDRHEQGWTRCLNELGKFVAK